MANYDLPKHAADKVKRSLDDVMSLTDDPAEMLRIALFASAVCVGQASGTLAGMMFVATGREVPKDLVQEEILKMITTLVTQGHEKAWAQLKERGK